MGADDEEGVWTKPLPTDEYKRWVRFTESDVTIASPASNEGGGSHRHAW